jgi:ATP-dependent Clp protease protease subunit
VIRLGKRFWQIRAAPQPKTGEVLLYGPIGSSTWRGDEVTPKQFREELEALGDVETIELYINSEGGDVFAAQAIHSMLRRHPARVHTFIDGLAASAASLVAMAGDTVTMPRNAMLMLHSPWAAAVGNANDLRATAEDLDRVRESMIAIYADRSGKSRDEVVQILDSETWYTAEEAVAAGFADEVEDGFKVAASVDLQPDEPQSTNQLVIDAARQARLRWLRLRAKT